MSRCAATMFAALATTALGAQDWNSTGGPPGGELRAIEAGAGRLIAGAGAGLFATSDGGETWSLLEVAPGPVRGIVSAAGEFFITTDAARIFRTDGATGAFVATPAARPVHSIGADGASLWAVASDEFGPGAELFISEDRAESWRHIETPEPVAAAWKAGDVLLAAPYATPSLYRSTDGGATWEPIGAGAGLPQFIFTSAFFGDGDTVLAAYISFTGAAGVARSDDLGRTWMDITGALVAESILDIELAAEHIYAVVRDRDRVSIDIWRAPRAGGDWTLRADGVLAGEQLPQADLAIAGGALLLATTDGALRSIDGGATWLQANDGLAATTGRSLAGTGAEALLAIGAPGRLWRFDAAGRAWMPIAFSPSAGNLLAVDAMDEATYLAGTALGGVRRSTDGGRTWRAVNTGVPMYEGLSGDQFREFAAFAARGETWLGAGGPGAEWPPVGSKGAAAQETGGGGVIRSTDGAASWQRFTTGLPIIDRAPDGTPHYPAALALIATTDGFAMGTKAHGVFRSADDGRSWSGASAGLPAGPIVALAEFDGALFAAAAIGSAVYRFDGSAWTPAAGGLPDAPAADLIVHEGRMFVALGAIRSGPDAGTGGGVWVTADGAAWERVGTALDGRATTALATLDGALLSATAGAGVWELDSACPADLDGDGTLTVFDFLTFGNLFAAGDPRADFDGDGLLTLLDFLAFQNAFAAGCL
ncbi:MAG: GC-type dockerin domain-anchored protein [Phycisphaerales bacterium JB039]